METMLDELIRHCEEVAEKNEKFCDKKYGDEYRQLAEWLKDYKQSLECESCEGKNDKRRYKSENL